jgi:hypothetical protein
MTTKPIVGANGSAAPPKTATTTDR